MHSLSPNCVIKRGRSHGALHGITEEQKEYQKAWNAWKRCCKKVDSQGGHFTGVHDGFLRDPVYRETQLAIGWTEQKCKEMDEPIKNRLHRESGEQVEKLIHPEKYNIWHPSSSTSWWNKNWKWAQKFVNCFFCYSWFRLQSMAIHCNRRGVDRYTSHVTFPVQKLN